MAKFLQINYHSPFYQTNKTKILDGPFWYDCYGIFIAIDDKFYTIDDIIRTTEDIVGNAPRIPLLSEINRALLMIANTPNKYHNGENIQKIELIKDIRQLNSCGLKEAKDFVDYLVEKGLIRVIGGKLQITFP